MEFSRENHLGSHEIGASVVGVLPIQQEIDYFDLLPDPILFLILNKIIDAKSIVRCLLVSKRFASLILQIDAVYLPLPRQIPIKKPTQNLPTKYLKNFLNKFVAKPIRFLHHFVSSKSRRNPHNFSYHSPNEVLKNFKEIKSIHVELPSYGGEVGLKGKDSFLKWNAEFGTSLKSCVILGATSFQMESLPPTSKNPQEDEENDETEPRLADEELKLRIVWMISCLIAASARHYLVKRVIEEFPMLSNAIVSDASKRGKLRMGEEQLAELRSTSENSPLSLTLEASLERSVIPDLNMKLWYVPQLDLPASGCVMKGATLIVIRPVDGVNKNGGDGDWLGAGFDGDEEHKAILGEAVREIMKKKKTYMMEMTSF
ncbi:hypothetical protein UlMin_029011 [Ulmus minor]